MCNQPAVQTGFTQDSYATCLYLLCCSIFEEVPGGCETVSNTLGFVLRKRELFQPSLAHCL